MFRDSHMWTALTVLTKLFSEFDGTSQQFLISCCRESFICSSLQHQNDSDARYPMFRDSYMWTALTVLTKLFSEFDGTTTIFNFMLSRILHLLEPGCSIKTVAGGEATSYHTLVFL
jgi:hypothetical protein